MPTVAIPLETTPGETRTAATPATVGRMKKLGLDVLIQRGAGKAAGFLDDAYTQAGATLCPTAEDLLPQADIVLRVRPPAPDLIPLLRPGCLHISFLEPFTQKPLLKALAERRVSAVAMELIPRSTRAQKMDALTSQANLAGYMAVLLGATFMDKVLPMMTTAAGTLLAARVLVIGAGVAGLQAIATARRLGARVEAFDTRPAVAEQIRSLGAKPVEIDLGQTGQTEQGYARELSPEQLARQREGLTAVCAGCDLIITTAQVFGKPAPRIITAPMLAKMRPGTVIVDLAAETGGNVEGSKPGEAIRAGDVVLLAPVNLPARLPRHASEVLAMNLFSFLEEFWDKKEKRPRLSLDDDILASSLIVHEGTLRDQRFA